MSKAKPEIKQCEVYRKADSVFSEHHQIDKEFYAKTSSGIVKLENPKDREEFRKLYLERYKRYYTVIPCP